jgi:GT2 family glycosyltransferase
MTDPIWVVMPVLAGPEMTEAAISDVLAQSVPTKLLIINQGVDDPFRERLERIAEQNSARVFVWHHTPPLPSLAASWNLGLELAWQSLGKVALVVNNDVRIHHETVAALATVMLANEALFVSGVGVTQEDYARTYEERDQSYAGATIVGHLSPFIQGLITPTDRTTIEKGGPDFSCFLISRECHQAFPFDENFVPAFCEDLDYHRRLMLAGEGIRIFSVNVPYLHFASQTLKQVSAPEAERIRGAIEHQSRAYYARKWGGPVNAETFYTPFDRQPDDVSDRFRSNVGPTTPDLQHWVQAGSPSHWDQMDQLLEDANGEATRGSQPERSTAPAAGETRTGD